MDLTAVFSTLCSTLAGCVFLFTGCIKVLAPSSSVSYLFKLGLKSFPLIRTLVWISAVAECVLGTALILRFSPAWLFPGAILLLIAFSLLTAWNAAKGEDDCGCYGKLLSVSPARSISLNACYAALAIVAWRIPVARFLPAPGEIAILAASAALFSAVTTFAHRYFVKQGKDWLDLNPLQVGRTWNPDWLQGFGDLASGDAQLVVLMSPTCPHCKTWMKPLNKISRRADMPQVIGGMAASEEEIRGLAAEFGITFPVLQVRPSVMDRIAAGYPDVIVLEKGVVREKTGARLPDELVQRLRNSIKPDARVQTGAG
ncbi:MAG TPA: MauE/DoxX family redox-associated membrane protein [Bryobacteraceae bacterium]|nr:MauE/DoxX family redox-associated membrane protein [Bryobacteraceae bacterium]